MQKQTINCGGKLLDISLPLVMGIVNITKDSFYDGGKFKNHIEIVEAVSDMLNNGASIIDVGAASTRPGASLIDSEDESAMLLPVVKKLVAEFPEAVFSVDTYNSETARAVIESGFHIINDVSAGELDSKMFDAVASLKVPYILMHMQGTPKSMQLNPVYNNVVNEVYSFLESKIEVLRQKLVNDIIIDPGFGFGKTPQHNYALLKHLSFLKTLGCPLLAGLSRKSMISKVLDIPVAEALNGTTVLNTIALQNGADILRVHDVAEAVEAVKLFNYYNSVA